MQLCVVDGATLVHALSSCSVDASLAVHTYVSDGFDADSPQLVGHVASVFVQVNVTANGRGVKGSGRGRNLT